MPGKIQVSPLRKIRESQMLSITELARMADLSTVTIYRVEQGESCRLETQKKILKALGLKFSDKDKVFG